MMTAALRRKTPPIVAISMGDPAGVGREVILKAAAALASRRGAPSIVVVGDLSAMRAAAARIRDVPASSEWHPGEPPIRPPKDSAYFPSRICRRAQFAPDIRPLRAAAPLMITL